MVDYNAQHCAVGGFSMADDHLDGEVQAAAGLRLTGIMIVDLFEDVPDLATGRPLCGVQRRLTNLSSSSPNAVCAAAAALALHHRPGRPPPTGDRPSRREHRNPSPAGRASPGQYRRTPLAAATVPVTDSSVLAFCTPSLLSRSADVLQRVLAHSDRPLQDCATTCSTGWGTTPATAT